MTNPKPKQIEVIKSVMEESLKTKSVKVEVSGSLASILFPSGTKIPKDMGEMRTELEQRGFIMFYSDVVVRDEPYLSINFSKL